LSQNTKKIKSFWNINGILDIDGLFRVTQLKCSIRNTKIRNSMIIKTTFWEIKISICGYMAFKVA
jgi:hypothetical protein